MKDETTHYDPEGKPEKLSMRAKIPKASLGLNKRAIILLGASILLIIGLVFIGALSPKDKNESYKADNKWNPHPGEAIQGLPNDYDELKRKKEEKRIFEAPKEVSQPLKKVPEKKLSVEEQLLAEYEITRLKEAIKARSSDVEFIGLKARLESLQNSKKFSFQKGESLEDRVGGQGEIGSFNPRDEDNRQDEKEAFLNARRDSSTHLSGSVAQTV